MQLFSRILDRASRVMRLRCRAGSLVAAIGLAIASSGAAWATPPAVKIGATPLLTPGDAAAAYASSTSWTNSTDETVRSADVRELARALKNDPDLIYEFVRDNIEITWTYGLSKGATGAIIDRSGNAFDQAHLMVELLRQSGISASYQIGTITLTGAQFQAWSGITNASAACQLLSSGSIPAVINGATTANCNYGAASVNEVELGHIWVKATIDGADYVFDPAYKTHTFKAGVDLVDAADFTPGDALAAALTSSQSGSDAGVPFVQQLNGAGLTIKLNQYAQALQGQLDGPLADKAAEDIVGGAVINRVVRPAGGWRQTALPYAFAVTRTIGTANPADATLGNLPDKYRTSLRVQVISTYPVGPAIDKLLFVDQIYGRRLVHYTTFNGGGSGGTIGGELRLLDENAPAVVLQAGDPTYRVGKGGDYILTIDMPYAAEGGGYMDATFTRLGLQAASPNVIVHGWGRVGAGLIDRWGAPADSGVIGAEPQGGCDTTCTPMYKPSHGEGRRQVLAANWLAQTSRGAELNAAIAKSIYTHHYSVGLVAADTRIGSHTWDPNHASQTTVHSIIDSFDRMDIETGMSLTSKTADVADRRAGIHAIAATLEALEGSVSAQVSDLPDTTSSATRFEWGNAPPATEDVVGGGVSRKFYAYDETNSAQALGLSKVQLQLSSSNDIRYLKGSPVISGSEVNTRRGQLATAIQAYTVEGFSVVASEEAFLGPGQRFGAMHQQGVVDPYWKHTWSRQRGGALIAKKYDANGDPLLIAHAAINDDAGIMKGGGGGAQAYHQAQYDPSKAADVLRARFVDRSSALGVDLKSGRVTYTSPASLSVGAGEFPYKLDAQIFWRGGAIENHAFGPISHIAPTAPWSTNWNNTLTISGSGLEAMGKTDVRAMAGTIAAFLALQDVYRATPSAAREVTGALVEGWWVRQLAGNVVTVNVGADTRQFVRKANNQWFAPGPGSYATLTQFGARSIVARADCQLFDQVTEEAPTRGWRNTPGMAFEVTGANGDVQRFERWEVSVLDAGSTWCGVQQGFRLKTWTWPKNVQLTFDYGADSEGMPVLTRVSNNLGRKIEFVDNGLGGFSNGLTGADLRSVSVTPPSLFPFPQFNGVYLHTDANNKTTKFDVARVGDSYRLVNVYGADDPNVPALAYQYDDLGRVKLASDKLAVQGPRAAHQFLIGAGLRGERVDPEQGRYSVDFDDDGRPIRVIDERGFATLASYDGRGRLSSYTYPEGDREEFEYDGRNNTRFLRKYAKPGSPQAGQVLTIEATWDATWNKVASLKDPLNRVTTFTYHPQGSAGAGEVATVVRPAVGGQSPTYAFTYNAKGQLLASTDPTGVVTTNDYDTAGFLQSVSVPLPSGGNAVTTYTNNPHGDPTDINGPRTDVWDVSHIEYDVLRRKVLEAQPDPGTGKATAVKTSYDDVGRVWKTEQGYVQGGLFTSLMATTVQFDAVGNKVRETLMGGSTLAVQTLTQFSYDGLDRLVCTAKRLNSLASPPTDACAPGADGPNGQDQVTQNLYLADGKLREVVVGKGRLDIKFARYEYSANGQRTAVIDGVNNRTTLVYDGFDRLATQYFPSKTRGADAHNPADYEAYGYDPNGNRTSLRKRDGTQFTFVYDALDRQTDKLVAGSPALNVNFGYDLAGRPTSALFASTGQGVTLHYDSAGRLDSETSYGRTVAYQLDAAGNRTRLTWPDSQAVEYVYDAASRLTKIREPGATAAPGVLAEIFYDDLGRRIQLARGNNAYALYAYDDAGRLSSLTQSGSTSSTVPMSVQTISYTPANQIAKLTQAAMAYVWQGQPTTTKNFTFNGQNQDAALAALPNGFDANGNLTQAENRSYAYDAENRLISSTSGGTTTLLTYDPQGRLLSTGASGGAQSYFLYSGDELIGEYAALATGAPSLRKYVHGDGVDDPLVWYEGADNTQRKWFHADRQGSIIGVSDAGGAVVAYSYGPYGEPNDWSGPRFRYTGQAALPEIGAYHYKARVYDPGMGRFLQTDPIGQEDDLNLYAYAAGDPLTLVDTNGEAVVPIVRGRTVRLVFYMQYRGAGATPKVVERFNKGIERYWTGKFGRYNVTAVAIAPPPGMSPDLINSIDVPAGDGRAYVAGVGGNEGRWPAGRPAWTAAHEAGHLAGLDDRYDDIAGPDPGYESNIMGARDQLPSELDIESIIRGNRIDVTRMKPNRGKAANERQKIGSGGGSCPPLMPGFKCGSGVEFQ